MSDEKPNKVRSAAFQSIAGIFDRFISTARAESCFGQPVQVGDKTIIPAAEVVSVVGFGVGYGDMEDEGNSKKDAPGNGGGGGVGGMIRSRAVAVVVVTPDSVTIEPVIDATQVAMAGIAATAFVGYWLVRMMKATEASQARGGPSLRSVGRLLKHM